MESLNTFQVLLFFSFFIVPDYNNNFTMPNKEKEKIRKHTGALPLPNQGLDLSFMLSGIPSCDMWQTNTNTILISCTRSAIMEILNNANGSKLVISNLLFLLSFRILWYAEKTVLLLQYCRNFHEIHV